MNVKYGITEERYALGNSFRISYGIVAYANPELDGTATVLCSVHDVTSDKERLSALAKACNKQKLSPSHLQNVVEDFLGS